MPRPWWDRRSTRALLLGSAAVLAAASCAAAQIVQPRDDATLHANDGVVHVVVQGVLRGDAVRPVLDGQPAHVYYATPVFDLRHVPRGSHQLYVQVLGPRDREVGHSPVVHFQVWQASRLNPPAS